MSRDTSQVAKLLKLLSDGKAHSTHQIQELVYGRGHLGTANIKARVHELRTDGHLIDSWHDPEVRSMWWYQLRQAPPYKKKLVTIRYIKDDGASYAWDVPEEKQERARVAITERGYQLID